MNARNNPLFNRDRLGSLGLVLAAHVLLACTLLYVMRAPVRHPSMPDLVVTLQAISKPPAAQAPVPLAIVKPMLTLNIRPELPSIPQAEISIQASAAPATPTPQPVKQSAPEIHMEPAKEIAALEDTSPTVDASATGNPKPVYPRASKALGEEGRVMLDVYVQADGTVGDIHLHQSSGFDRLDDSALRAVRQWRFKPARQFGKQIAMWYVQPITFNLHDA
jgi:protein TonB